MPTVEEGIQAQLRNIEKSYGQTIDALVAVVAESGLAKHGDVVAMLKQRYGMSHGAAHRVALVARARGEQPASGATDRMGPGLNDVYRRLLETVKALGPDIEEAPKKGYVSLRRRKQFAMLQPGAKWINLGLILPKQQTTARLEPAAKWNALFTHRFEWRRWRRSTASLRAGSAQRTRPLADQFSPNRPCTRAEHDARRLLTGGRPMRRRVGEQSL